ncbi:HAMP domain-containing protein [Nitrospina watsonii]|uniref:Methyl-accepting chemotaxis protein n=1 Tax=Nitrospina watsonii TaxID=1323948 RepID=A0ABN8VYX5_9BACT|nr:HAMP domain-containing protein [Nitrospina watsonii]CAI2718979.1 Putative Methyl-accepting chemotaxis protein [Nitrospina watsonii]
MVKFRDCKVSTKIGVGFGLITVILMGVVLVTIQQVKNMEAITKRVVTLRTPTAHSSLMMLNGMNHSLASLRGWVILGDSRFKQDRAAAWSEQIEPSLQQLHQLAPQWEDEDGVEMLRSIEKDLKDFKQFQQDIEGIAQTVQNTPARQILFEKAQPVEERLITYITRMINLEMRIPPSSQNRKALLAIMADLEGTTSLAFEKAEEFLLSGDKDFKKQFEESWVKNTERFNDLKRNFKLLSEGQKKVFKRLEQARNEIEPLLHEIIQIRSGEEWNMANAWLVQKAIPVSSRIKSNLNKMTETQNRLLDEDMKEISSRTHFLITLLVLLFFMAALMAGVLGSAITRTISEPIQQVSHMAREMAKGNLRQKKLPIHARDEVGDLADSFNQLLEKMKGK